MKTLFTTFAAISVTVLALATASAHAANTVACYDHYNTKDHVPVFVATVVSAT
jgi:hypothetical protein